MKSEDEVISTAVDRRIEKERDKECFRVWCSQLGTSKSKYHYKAFKREYYKERGWDLK